MPTVYLDSWAWVQARKRAAADGRPDPWPCGRHSLALTIMAMPRGHYGECGDGRVPWLVPSMAARDLMVESLAARDTPLEPQALRAYRDAFESQLREAEARGELAPGRLAYAVQWGSAAPRHAVPDGATLCCACSRSRAASGRCHRAWIAPHLTRAGWTVYLDGVLVTPESTPDPGHCRGCQSHYIATDWPGSPAMCLVANGCFGTDLGQRVMDLARQHGGYLLIPECPGRVLGEPLYVERQRR